MMLKIDKDGREVPMTRKEEIVFFAQLIAVSALWGVALYKLWHLIF